MNNVEFSSGDSNIKVEDVTVEDYLKYHGGYSYNTHSVLSQPNSDAYPLPDYPNPQPVYGVPPYNRRMDVLVDMLKNLKPKNGTRAGRQYKPTGRDIQHYRLSEDDEEYMKIFGKSFKTPTTMQPAPFGKIEIIEAKSVPQSTSADTTNKPVSQTPQNSNENSIRRAHFEPTTQRYSSSSNGNIEIVKSNEINLQDYQFTNEVPSSSSSYSSQENEVYLSESLPKYNSPVVVDKYGPPSYKPAPPLYELPKPKPAVVYGPVKSKPAAVYGPPSKPRPVYGVPNNPDIHIHSNEILGFSPENVHHHEYHVGSHPTEQDPPKWLTFPIENLILEKLGLSPPGAKPREPSVVNCGKLYVVGILWRSLETYLAGL